MNKKETQKIANELNKLGFEITANDSDILWHGRKAYNDKREYRDANKNLCKLREYFSVHFDAGINPNGIGDGKQPDKALTYSIDFTNHGTIRLYRHKEFYEEEHLKFYGYSRDLNELLTRFKQHLATL